MTQPRTPPDVDTGDMEGGPMTGGWTLDRRVPIPLIISLGIYALVQASAIGYWVANINGRMDASEIRTAVIERQLISATSAAAPVSERLVRVEVQIGTIKETVDKIEALIRRAPRAD